MANKADIKAVITAEDRASATLRGFGDHVSGIGGKIAGAAKLAGEALLAAGAAAAGFGALSVKAFSESQDVQAQLQAVLKSTHNAAGTTIDDLNKQSAALQKVTKFDDETIGSVQAMLLTFTNIKQTLPEATTTVLDMATALGEDTKSASIQLGKALQDPILGVTALRRVGVNFNASQQEMIKGMVESGHQLEAQKFILKELQTEFGGSAKAAGDTFAGKLAQLKNALNDIEESIGQVIVQYLTPLIKKIADFVKEVDWSKVIDKSVRVLKEFGRIIGETGKRTIDFTKSVITYVTPGIERFIGILKELAQIFMTHIWPSIQAVFVAFRDRLMPQLIALWNTIEPGFTAVLKVLAVILGVTIVAAIKIMLVALDVAISVLGGVIRVIRNLIGWFGNLGGVIINVFRGIPNAIGKAFHGLVDIITWPFKTAFNAVADFWNNTVGKLHWTVPKWIPKLGGHEVGAPHIPKLAEGGIVTRPTLAMIGESGAEAVIPLKKAGGMGNVSITIQAGAYLGSKLEARKHAQMIMKAMQEIAASKNTTVSAMMGGV